MLLSVVGMAWTCFAVLRSSTSSKSILSAEPANIRFSCHIDLTKELMLKEMQVLQEPQNERVHYVPVTGGIRTFT